jgi:hypothetical protein
VVFFEGKLIFEQETLFSRMLHNHTPMTLEQRLQFQGLQMIILPVRVLRIRDRESELLRPQV